MIRRMLANLIGGGNVGPVDDTGPVQTMQVTEGAAGAGFADRTTDDVSRISEFGFSSVPPEGAQVVMIRRGGDRSCSIIIGTSHQASRPTGLQAGDTALYDVRGVIIHLTDEGPVIDCAGLPFTIQNTSGAHIKGALTVDDDLTVLAASSPLVMSTLRTNYNVHTHPVSGSATLKPVVSI